VLYRRMNDDGEQRMVRGGRKYIHGNGNTHNGGNALRHHCKGDLTGDIQRSPFSRWREEEKVL